MKHTTIFCIFDGFGLRAELQGNAIANAHMPNFRRIMSQYPWTTLDADGESVGQETGLVGNSEVGHMNLGGLKLVKQLSFEITETAQHAYDADYTRSVQNFDPKVFLRKYFEHDEARKTVHIVGLFSVASIHSDMRHWIAAIEASGIAGAESIILHIISDGRDSDRQSLVQTWEIFCTRFSERLKPYQDKILLGSVGGRFYAMDRDKNWERTRKGLDALTMGTGTKIIRFTTIKATLEEITRSSYGNDVYDEYIEPVGFIDGIIQTRDVVWLLNFRSDRMKQMTQKLCEFQDQIEFGILANNSYGIGYEGEFSVHIQTHQVYYPIFQTKTVEGTLAESLSEAGKTQLHIAETEKYAHVTYFFDGGKEQKQPGEDWHIIDSHKVKSHSEKPEMRAVEVTDYILEQGIGIYDCIVVNYANPDMVGHTGDYEASLKALEVLDVQLGRLLEVIEAAGHTLILTADHGNIEEVGKVHTNSDEVDTKHNANPVPLIIVANEKHHLAMAKKLPECNLSSEANILLQKLLHSHSSIQLTDRWLTYEEIPPIRLQLWHAGLLVLVSVMADSGEV